ncbi:MAG: GyrI-like domain-containing protein [Chloroflexi bacterium]|nr:GyrI-like domain-containing protein [Chloroflexota bacterium]
MNYRATVVTMPALLLAVCRAHTFPEGIKDAWNRLEAAKPSLKGRRFYGLTVCEGDKLAYYAAVEVTHDEEAAALGFPVLRVKGGPCARVKLRDWPKHVDEIGDIFADLMRRFTMAPDAPTVEYYRSQSELHLLLPLAHKDE